jgi:hypothetical protein
MYSLEAKNAVYKNVKDITNWEVDRNYFVLWHDGNGQTILKKELVSFIYKD